MLSGARLVQGDTCILAIALVAPLWHQQHGSWAMQLGLLSWFWRFLRSSALWEATCIRAGWPGKMVIATTLKVALDGGKGALVCGVA